MNSLNRLLSFSDCIQKLIKNMENQECLELLNDLLKEEENYLNSLNDREWQKLIAYMKENYNLMFVESVYEVAIKEEQEKNLIRVYALIKEKMFQKEITYLKEEELESLLLKKNPLACKINQLKDSMKKLEISLLNKIEENQEDMVYYLTSYSTPDPTYKDILFKSEQEYFIESIKETIKENVGSLLAYLLTGKNKKIKKKFCKIIEGYVSRIPQSLQEEMIREWKENLLIIKESQNTDNLELKKSLDYLDSLTFKKEIKKNHRKTQGIENIKDFTYEEMIYYENTFKDLFAINGSELKLFLEIKESKLNFENKTSREELYIKLAKLTRIKNEMQKKISDTKKLKTYIKLTNDWEPLKAPFDWLDAVKNKNIMKRLIINRLLNNITVIENKEILKNGVHLVMQKEHSYLLRPNDNIIDEESEILDGVNYCINTKLYDFIIYYLLNHGLDSDLFTTLILILYNDPHSTEELIKNDFEYNCDKSFVMTYQTYEKYKEKIYEEIELAYQEFQEREDDFSRTVFVNYIKNLSAILPEEDYQKIQKIYYDKLKKYNRSLKK